MKRLLVLAGAFAAVLLLSPVHASAPQPKTPGATKKLSQQDAPFYASGGRLYRSYDKNRPAPSAADAAEARRLWKALHGAKADAKKPAHARPASKRRTNLGKEPKKQHTHSGDKVLRAGGN